MEREHGVAGKSVEETLVDHDLRATGILLRRLKDEVNRAVEIPSLGKRAGGAEQHRRVAVMTAGMHQARFVLA